MELLSELLSNLSITDSCDWMEIEQASVVAAAGKLILCFYFLAQLSIYDGSYPNYYDPSPLYCAPYLCEDMEICGEDGCSIPPSPISTLCGNFPISNLLDMEICENDEAEAKNPPAFMLEELDAHLSSGT